MPETPATVPLGEVCTIEQAVTQRDSEIYALGIGLGDDPLSPDDLGWFLDPARGAFPTMASTLCHPRKPAQGAPFGHRPFARGAFRAGSRVLRRPSPLVRGVAEFPAR